jgi:hypothetical protein
VGGLHGFDHTCPGDLRARLIHPDGVTSVDLLSRPLRGAGDLPGSNMFGTGSDFVRSNRYVFSDNGTILFLPHPFGGVAGGWQEGPTIRSGTYRPSSNDNPPESDALGYLYTPVSFRAAFGGRDPAGVWTLEIVEWANGFDTGSLDGWTLHLCSGLCPRAAPKLGDERLKLTAFDAGLAYNFGARLALSGNTAIVGSPFHSGLGVSRAGAAYLFDTRTGHEVARLTPGDDAPRSMWFGISVAIDGDTALVGAEHNRQDVVGAGFATGSVSVYDVSDPARPVLRRKLLPADATGNTLWEFGSPVAILGQLAVVGASGADSPRGTKSGQVYLFDLTTRQELVRFNAADTAADDGFGGLAGSGHTLLISAPRHGDTGAIYVFDVSDLPAASRAAGHAHIARA